MSEKQLSVETQYEKNQSFNAIMAWFHSLRYKNILEVFSPLDFTSARPIKVVDIGCAHAKLFSVLDPKFQIDYVGIETDGGFVDVARERYFRKPNVSIIHASAITALEKIAHPDIIVALETLEHIPERDVVRLIEKIATVEPS